VSNHPFIAAVISLDCKVHESIASALGGNSDVEMFRRLAVLIRSIVSSEVISTFTGVGRKLEAPRRTERGGGYAPSADARGRTS
jgi:hypothetical protein